MGNVASAFTLRFWVCLLVLVGGGSGLFAQSASVIVLDDIADPLVVAPPNSPDETLDPSAHEAVTFTLENGTWLIQASTQVVATEVFDLQGHHLLHDTQAYHQARLIFEAIPNETLVLRVQTEEGVSTLQWQQQ